MINIKDEMPTKRILIFGTGCYYHKYKKYLLKENEVLAVVDNNYRYMGDYIDGIRIIGPEKIKEYEYDYIYILVRNSEDIFHQLLNMKIETGKIKFYYDVHHGEKSIACQGVEIANRRKIVIVLHELNYDGVPMCACTCAEILVKNGYNVVTISLEDGPVKERLERIGARVIINPDFSIDSIITDNNISDASLIIVNTVILHFLFQSKERNIPIVWWLHESKMLFEKCVYKSLLEEINLNNVYIYAVSDVAKNDVSSLLDAAKIKKLMLGISDKDCSNFSGHNKIKFVIIGKLCVRKGQDILMEALEELNPEIIAQCEFYFLGNIPNDNYSKEIEGTVQKNNYPVFFCGTKDNEEVLEYLDSSDCLICPSREETVSISVIEALRAKRLVVTSIQTGVAEYLTDGDNAFVFDCHKPVELAEKIEYIVKNIRDLDSVANQGRKCFEKYFSESAFESRLLEEIKSIESR